MEIKWWNNPNIKKFYGVGQCVKGIADDGQDGCWMLEGLFETEDEAIMYCTEPYHFVVPLPLGMMIGLEIPDGMFWPLLETKEEGQKIINESRGKK